MPRVQNFLDAWGVLNTTTIFRWEFNSDSQAGLVWLPSLTHWLGNYMTWWTSAIAYTLYSQEEGLKSWTCCQMIRKVSRLGNVSESKPITLIEATSADKTRSLWRYGSYQGCFPSRVGIWMTASISGSSRDVVKVVAQKGLLKALEIVSGSKQP